MCRLHRAMSAALGTSPVFWALTALSLVVNAAALALPSRSFSSLAVGFGGAILTFAVAAVIGPFLYPLPAAVAAVLAAREWSYRWCLLSLPVAAIAYFLFDIVRPVRWPFLLLTLCAYAIPAGVHLHHRLTPAPPL